MGKFPFEPQDARFTWSRRSNLIVPPHYNPDPARRETPISHPAGVTAEKEGAQPNHNQTTPHETFMLLASLALTNVAKARQINE